MTDLKQHLKEIYVTLQDIEGLKDRLQRVIHDTTTDSVRELTAADVHNLFGYLTAVSGMFSNGSQSNIAELARQARAVLEATIPKVLPFPFPIETARIETEQETNKNDQ